MGVLLDRIRSPEDLKKLPLDALPQLAAEIRERIISVVSKTGGHLASNLGSIELTIALHYVFDSPHDKLLFDVGHQSYTHKLLTGRSDRFDTLRTYGGISGFPHFEESEHDPYTVGHAGTSISSALGLNEGMRRIGDPHTTVAIIGDGSLTAGLAFEGLNQSGHLDRNIIIVVNDNKMSISPNVGALSSYLSRKLTGNTATAIRKRLKNVLRSIPQVGDDVFRLLVRLEEGFKGAITPGFLFEALGFEYVGPIEGHWIERLVETFQNVKRLDHSVVVHVHTIKGYGYLPAESEPWKFHGVGPFDPATGKTLSKPGPKSYTQIFGETLVKLANADKKILGITAAMPSGTGLEFLATDLPDQFYDVGITEQHSVTFASGLAKMGFKPVVAIYSTFLQRALDQIIHDVALQNLPVIFAVDRAGLVGDDGPTHHGSFDLSFLRLVPGLIIASPKDEAELVNLLYSAFRWNSPAAIRYPRGVGIGAAIPEEPSMIEPGKGELLREGKDGVIAAIGNMVLPSMKAAEQLAAQGISVSVINARFAKPIDAELICSQAKATGRVLTVEENAAVGGFGAGVLETLADAGILAPVRVLGLPDHFVEHGAQNILRANLGLDADGIAEAMRRLLTSTQS